LPDRVPAAWTRRAAQIGGGTNGVPGRPATFFLATGLDAGIVSTDRRRRQDIRERL
jgi:hypothetical protein